MKPQRDKRILSFLKFLPLIVCMILIVFFLASDTDITVQTILNYTPESPFAAAIVILLLYALKSVSFVFPVVVLQIAAGHLFHTPAALLINFLGRAITLSIPYWVGRFSGSDLINNLQKKYPKIKKICDKQERNPVFISFLLRTFCKLISRRHRDTLSLLFDRRNSGNHFRRSIGNHTRFQYHRTRFPCLLAFGFPDGSYGNYFRLPLPA